MLTRRVLIQSVLALGAMSPMALWAAPKADPTADPEAWVLQLSNEVLNLIRADAKLAEADPERVKQFVKEIVIPSVDFLRMTRMCVGPKWRTATDAQREELQSLFRELLTRVYSGALKTVTDQVAELAPNRAKNTEKDALVRTLLVSKTKPVIHLNYRLKKVDGRWWIIDGEVEGIWIGENYRNQFASTINQSGIPGLIETLKQKNAEMR